MIVPRPVIITTRNEMSKTAKRTLFRTALCVAMFGSVVVSTILFLQGSYALGNLSYYVDIGQHPLHITSTFLIIFGLLSISTFIILSIGLIKMNRNFAIIAAVLLIICSLSLIVFSIWSFVTLSTGHLSKSINDTLVKELSETQYVLAPGNNLIVENTIKMAKLEKQHECCGNSIPIEDYRNQQMSTYGSVSQSGNTKGRPTGSQKNPSSILLPISCCKKNYISTDGNQCSGNSTDLLSRYYTNGCYDVILQEKSKHIRQQGFATIVAGTLAVISSIALAAVIRLLKEGFQVVPIRTTT